MSQDTENSDSNSPLCLYPSKPCSNPRAVKTSGELHNLCEQHRRRANVNQQKLKFRQRLQRLREMQELLDAEAKSLAEQQPEMTAVMKVAAAPDEQEADLTDAEIAMLLQMLDD
ncbi:hypothetical protein Poli38472_001866 [Pythium oligandrum]|uniref:Uncharacterized protein n=1 Tax=Pythium oligandrum TaxID=41045 RepID=A0A8K1CW02_PYTOL|nr:hypothetical protein Poli38472_001866 [Pythium oligandrum]|eukprot:TMW69710.1 hypothetical protein Poli38472_001866 [Pythium oligandrum]